MYFFYAFVLEAVFRCFYGTTVSLNELQRTHSISEEIQVRNVQRYLLKDFNGYRRVALISFGEASAHLRHTSRFNVRFNETR